MSRPHAMHNWSSAKFWLNCDHWYGFKSKAAREGKSWDTGGAAADRGHKLHEELESILLNTVDGGVTVDELKAGPPHYGPEAYVAAQAIMDVLKAYPAANVGLEIAVPLPHEPESDGYVDVAFWDELTLGVIDAKFGQVRVEPDSEQNMGYAYSLLCELSKRMEKLPEQIFLGIAQPAHSDDVLYVIVPTDEVIAFGRRANEKVERQIAGKDLEHPSDLSTCGYCPAARVCGYRVSIMAGMMSALNTGGATATAPDASALLENPDLVEQIVRSRSEIERMVKECVEIVVGNPDMFPDWRRTRVANARKFDLEVRDEAEIVKLLEKVGVDWPWALATPAALKKGYPEFAEAIEALTVDMGEHVRLSPLGAVARRAKQDRPPAASFTDAVQQAMQPATPVPTPEAPAPKARKAAGTKVPSTRKKALEEIEGKTTRKRSNETKKRGKK